MVSRQVPATQLINLGPWLRSVPWIWAKCMFNVSGYYNCLGKLSMKEGRMEGSEIGIEDRYETNNVNLIIK